MVNFILNESGQLVAVVTLPVGIIINGQRNNVCQLRAENVGDTLALLGHPAPEKGDAINMAAYNMRINLCLLSRCITKFGNMSPEQWAYPGIADLLHQTDFDYLQEAAQQLQKKCVSWPSEEPPITGCARSAGITQD